MWLMNANGRAQKFYEKHTKLIVKVSHLADKLIGLPLSLNWLVHVEIMEI